MKKLICLILCTLFICTGCFRKIPKGEIIALSDDFVVGQAIPFVFEVPEEFDILHKEMWSCTLEVEEDSIYKMDYIEEEYQLKANYTQAEIESLFDNSPIDIYRADYAMETYYSPRIMLFTPMESGKYTIGVSGYYKSTSPSDIATLEVIVHEK